MKEMIQIMTHLHQYIPQLQQTEQQPVPETNETEEVCTTKMYPIMFGGDQLTKARAVAAIKVKSNSETPPSRLEGFFPVVEDWHAKLTLFEVRSNIIINA